MKARYKGLKCHKRTSRARMRPKPTQKERTLQAFRVYLEVMETASWLRSWMQGPLEAADLTPHGFRLLLLLYEEGPLRTMEAAQRMKCKRQTLDGAVERLEARGWVKRYNMTLPPAERRRRSRARRLGRQKRRWGLGTIALTSKGENFLARVFPHHTKVLKALMRAVSIREQRALVEICRKLRAGAILKFMSELSMLDEWETGESIEVDAADDADETRGSLLEERKRQKDSEERAEAEAKLRVELMETVEGIVGKMKKYNILKEAKNVDWNLPRDEEREAGHVIRMLRNCGTERERKVLEQVCRVRTNREVVAMLREAAGEDGGDS